MKVLGIQTKKLDNRSKQVINLGKEPGTKAYRLYDPEGKRVYVSRDVFEESKCWSWNHQEEKEPNSVSRFSVPSIQIAKEDNPDSPRRTQTYEIDDFQEVSPQSQSPKFVPDPANYDDSHEPKRFKSIRNVYETEEVELGDGLFLMGVDEPVTYKQAVKDKNWRLVMNKEIESIEKNSTWRLTELPVGHKVIGLKWIYKIKKDASGNTVKYKARLVTKGYLKNMESTSKKYLHL